eukprot:gene19730-39188_t
MASIAKSDSNTGLRAFSYGAAHPAMALWLADATGLLPRIQAQLQARQASGRVADDMVDGGTMGIDDAMRVLSHRLDRIYAGEPQDFVEDRALSVVVQRHDLPRPLLDALLDGFAWDAQGRRYDTLEQVHDYGARVAGSVGAM